MEGGSSIARFPTHLRRRSREMKKMALDVLNGEVKATNQETKDGPEFEQVKSTEERDEIRQTLGQNLLSIESATFQTLDSCQEFVKNLENAAQAFLNFEKKLDEMFAIEGRMSPIYSQFRSIEDPFANGPFMTILQTFSRSLEDSRRFYRLLVDSFKDRLVIRDLIRERFEKAQKKYLKSRAGNVKKMEETTATYTSLKNTFETFDHELCEDMQRFIEQRQDPFDNSLLTLMNLKIAMLQPKDNEQVLIELIHKCRRLIDFSPLSSGPLDRPSIKAFITDEVSVEYFRQFLVMEHAEENLDFFEQAMEYSSMADEDEACRYGCDIYDMYIASTSPIEINLGHAIRVNIEKKMGLRPLPSNLFDEAVDAVINLLSIDAYERFLRSEYYTKYQRRFGKKDFFGFTKPQDFHNLQESAIKEREKRIKEESKLGRRGSEADRRIDSVSSKLQGIRRKLTIDIGKKEEKEIPESTEIQSPRTASEEQADLEKLVQNAMKSTSPKLWERSMTPFGTSQKPSSRVYKTSSVIARKPRSTSLMDEPVGSPLIRPASSAAIMTPPTPRKVSQKEFQLEKQDDRKARSTSLSQSLPIDRSLFESPDASDVESAESSFSGYSMLPDPVLDIKADVPVRVVVRIRPVLPHEGKDKTCTRALPGENQITVENKVFNYDCVFVPENTQAQIFNTILPLIDSLFEGYNATVLAYGQTGSGKTFTMGTADSTGQGEGLGIIPRAIHAIFDRIESKSKAKVQIKASFVELYNEEIRDMLSPFAQNSQTSKEFIIQSDKNGTFIRGIREEIVTTREGLLSVLSSGSKSRTTASTLMNSESSRSHAIFTIQVVQNEDGRFVTSKFHFVDLAGSERLGKTKAEGMQMKEGISINGGLLVLGNVISALGKKKKMPKIHVPYRDSKLTRLLQDSLGGNSRTVMIACVSPARSNMEETINTLRYSQNARKIENKPVIGMDPIANEISSLRSQVKLLHSLLEKYKKGIDVIKEDVLPQEKIHEGKAQLEEKIGKLEAENEDLRNRFQEIQLENERLQNLQIAPHSPPSKVLST
eukprot:TRINITY_DN6491_c1_g1_i1.p1 TRINITY_DN6491_c1_g1~~TRINITY_DN6491_c1_g1_i1.p1  ORF type:complete len:1049 (+),score=285.94 TRINITY_DN6491_c1_g1_i1:117-3263(+)